MTAAPPGPHDTETSNTTEPAPAAGRLWLNASDQQIVAVICALLLAWVGIRQIELSQWGREEIEIRHQQPRELAYLVDLNSANWLEFSLLEGIGEVLGKRIVAYRDEHGPFTAIEQIRQVRGIGEKTYARIAPHLTIGSGPAGAERLRGR
ncbi:ComEA family DNA-binding protein [Rubinisphaera margarita]|uniref:ComEA family DNA-binding protein n=1 Tax=Rubinisphaera margarita TaxID=2909586 RepID=UPI001EE92A78|nr:helix-hairpin-helix domain-containing protein [Rubinisphaera margarita]MCG6157800.1 helix-hairpin-helix domain-containing protein [Rubinisphaera margarita]